MTERKINILAKFFQKSRYQNDPDLELLFGLDDMWNEKYRENRIKLDFSQAAVIANETVIEYIDKTNDI